MQLFYPGYIPRPMLTATAFSIRDMVGGFNSATFCRRRLLSMVRICSAKMTESRRRPLSLAETAT